MHQMKRVALVKCSSYHRQEVEQALDRAIGLLGGWKAFISPGQKVLIKPNLLIAATPDKCITTHPEVVRAVAKSLMQNGCHVTIADSPGAGVLYTESALRKAYSLSGWQSVAEELGAELNFRTDYREVPCPEGRMLKRFLIIEPALEAEVIISLPKAKTHMLTTMTGAVKNLFGVVPSIEKPALHARFPSLDAFSDMLLDLNQLIRPRLHIMDAIIGMEGDGPHTGEPRHIGAILASEDPHALDYVAARIMSLEPMEVGTLAAAQRRGLIRADGTDIELVGDELNDFVIKDFKRPRTKDRQKGFSEGRLASLALSLVKAYSLRPQVDREICTGCGRCERICPKGAVTVRKGKARIRARSCIRCFCCHEMCASKAIVLRRSASGRVLARLVERRSKG
ncbi:MAG: DUF362 domain-containing protein [Methanomassiliicoccales archaeon]